MSEDDLDEWEDIFRYETTLKRTISLGGLIERWAGKKIAGYESAMKSISQLVRQTDQLPAYVMTRLIECSGGNKNCRVRNISYPEMKLALTTENGLSAVLFDLDDVKEIEREKFTSSKIQGKDNLQERTDCNPRSRHTLYKLILGLVQLANINLAQDKLADALENATQSLGLRLPKSTIYALLHDILEYQRINQE